MPESQSQGVHLELFVRSLSPGGGARDRQAAAIRRLEELETRGTIDSFTVHICGRELPARPADAVTEFGTYLLNRIAVFQEWAAVNGRSLARLFEPEHVSCAMTGEDYTRIVMPVMALAEYEDGALRFVSPCAGDERTWSVPDRLAHLVDEGGEADGAEPLGAARAEPPDSQLLTPQ